MTIHIEGLGVDPYGSIKRRAILITFWEMPRLKAWLRNAYKLSHGKTYRIIRRYLFFDWVNFVVRCKWCNLYAFLDSQNVGSPNLKVVLSNDSVVWTANQRTEYAHWNQIQYNIPFTREVKYEYRNGSKISGNQSHW